MTGEEYKLRWGFKCSYLYKVADIRPVNGSADFVF